MVKNIFSGGAMILTTMDDDDLPDPVNADIVKNTTHNPRPARLTGLGQNKGFPANQKGSGKNKGWKWKKFVQSASRKPEKEAWAKIGIPMDWKPERAVQAKIRD